MTKPYKTHWYNRQIAGWFARYPARAAGTQTEPECIRLDAVDGYAPSNKPPVRIFVGTEPGQYRAARVFVWSVMKVRDPARVYEIYLMMDLKFIDRSDWTTGFTNYRYLVPHFCENSGRAIYNDTDQIYLSDPAKLFDTEMHGKAILAISEQENSVMLIDCELAGELWLQRDVFDDKKHAHFKNAMIERQLVGDLNGGWNSRDGEHPLEEIHCLHFTTLYKQPWRPFPKHIRYQWNQLGYVWHELEADADTHNYLLFTREAPSSDSAALILQYEKMHVGDTEALNANPEVPNPFPGGRLPKHTAAIAKLIHRFNAQTLLDYGAGKAGSYSQPEPSVASDPMREHPAWPGVKVCCYDPGYGPFKELTEGMHDGVISTDVVEHAAPFDVPWVLDEMFARASKFVYVVAACYPAKKLLPDGRNAHSIIQPPHWWHQLVALTAKRYPKISWKLVCEVKPVIGKKKQVVFDDTTACPLR